MPAFGLGTWRMRGRTAVAAVGHALARKSRFGDPRLGKVAAKHGRTPAQVMLRWCVQHGVVAIPKSADPGRIDENASLFDFELDGDDMELLDSLDEGYRECWDPSDVR
jgi:diketogulonate reductase-like aldo/keto reductase